MGWIDTILIIAWMQHFGTGNFICEPSLNLNSETS